MPDAEAQESYIFNKFGQHVITKDLMTGTTKFKMSYTQTTSTGKKVQIRDEVLTEFALCSFIKSRAKVYKRLLNKPYVNKVTLTG